MYFQRRIIRCSNYLRTHSKPLNYIGVLKLGNASTYGSLGDKQNATKWAERAPMEGHKSGSSRAALMVTLSRLLYSNSLEPVNNVTLYFHTVRASRRGLDGLVALSMQFNVMGISQVSILFPKALCTERLLICERKTSRNFMHYLFLEGKRRSYQNEDKRLVLYSYGGVNKDCKCITEKRVQKAHRGGS